MNKTYTESIASILEKIEYIEENLRHYATTQMALEDAATTRPAIFPTSARHHTIFSQTPHKMASDFF